MINHAIQILIAQNMILDDFALPLLNLSKKQFILYGFCPGQYRFYLKAARATEDVERTAKYLAVLALQGHEHLCYRPSTVASALVILASSAANLYASCHLVTEVTSVRHDYESKMCL